MKTVSILFNKIIRIILVIAAVTCIDRVSAENFVQNIEQTPLIFSNHDASQNTLSGSAYELLNQAHSSILLMSFTFSDPTLIQIINQKASEGVDIQLIIDRDQAMKVLSFSMTSRQSNWL